ncbi:hypothetical protein [Nitrogeniibacter aestuarii]|uniref:hypothetical protein n=1 Tax=Nitrogeniibacter aestuarii TaxID=2815343 RepID=UPI001E562F1E|nr:hypothetical protein [Nitrogeniibacter aestuarii]
MANVNPRTRYRSKPSAANDDRGGWFDSLKSEALSFFKGDNNAPWAILAETVIGCIPVVGQLVDARDIIKGLVEVSGAPASPLGWFNLITATIGLIPGGGDAAKRSLRAVKAGTANIDDLLAMIRRFYKGDPEKLLREVLDLSKVRKQLDDILANPNLTRHLDKNLRKQVDDIRAGLGKQFDAFKKEVDDWLTKGRKTSADAPTAKRAPGSPEAKPGTQAKEGKGAKGDHADDAQPNTPTRSSQRAERFKKISLKALGVLGEHMADYHCQDAKGWGAPALHDTGALNEAKLNDAHRMVQLWPTIVRGRGIDAVWKSNGLKPYAVVEAKASYDPTKSLKTLLGEAWDKTGKDGVQSGTTKKKGRSSKSSASTGNQQPATRQANGKVTQMGHDWIQGKRLAKAVDNISLAKAIERDGYTRHVLFFSIPQAVAHAEALILLLAQQSVDDGMHSAHEATREWGDRDIDKVVDNRAGFIGSGRDKRVR